MILLYLNQVSLIYFDIFWIFLSLGIVTVIALPLLFLLRPLNTSILSFYPTLIQTATFFLQNLQQIIFQSQFCPILDILLIGNHNTLMIRYDQIYTYEAITFQEPLTSRIDCFLLEHHIDDVE